MFFVTAYTADRAALFYDQVAVKERGKKGKTKEEFVLVYDPGGGTFDVTVLRTGGERRRSGGASSRARPSFCGS